MTNAVTVGAGTRAEPREVLTAVEFDVLWEWLRLGATPVALRLDSPGHTHAERARIVLAGWSGMRERGIADAAGPRPGLVRWLRVLAAPEAAAELRMWVGHSVRAVAAEADGVGVVAVRQDETVALHAAAALTTGLTGVLPPAPPGPGPARAVAAGHPLLRCRRRGQISALAMDTRGVLRRLPAVLGVLDTPAGRYLLMPDRARLVPGDRPAVALAVGELLAQARSAAAHAYLAS